MRVDDTITALWDVDMADSTTALLLHVLVNMF